MAQDRLRKSGPFRHLPASRCNLPGGSVLAATVAHFLTAINNLANVKWVAHEVHSSRRREELTFGQHDAVARLTPRWQRYWLAGAVHLSRRRDK